jgi:hypothetical protein
MKKFVGVLINTIGIATLENGGGRNDKNQTLKVKNARDTLVTLNPKP